MDIYIEIILALTESQEIAIRRHDYATINISTLTQIKYMNNTKLCEHKHKLDKFS